MRTSLTEIEQIETWLSGNGGKQDRLVFEARMLTNPELRENVQAQTEVYDLICLHGREKLRNEIREVGFRLFHTSKYKAFQDQVRSIFND